MSTIYRKSVAEAISKGAEFSECGKYRYALWRIWDDRLQKVMCIGLNPSTANAEKDDNTISNLTRILKRAGYGGFYMMNLFALISPHPEDLRACPDPVKYNDIWLKKISELCEKEVVFCWGNFPIAEYRAKKIIPQYPLAMCFGRNGNGSPKHPLYLKGDTKLRFYYNA